jgi:hypothetical protein
VANPTLQKAVIGEVTVSDALKIMADKAVEMARG